VAVSFLRGQLGEMTSTLFLALLPPSHKTSGRLSPKTRQSRGATWTALSYDVLVPTLPPPVCMCTHEMCTAGKTAGHVQLFLGSHTWGNLGLSWRLGSGA
jgi:hypothetical protein